MQSDLLSPIAKRVFEIYNGPSADKDPHRHAFFSEVVNRCIADTAGMLQTVSADDSAAGGQPRRPGTELGKIYAALAERYSPKTAQSMILLNLPGFAKGQVHTPHPTEVFTDEAIFAEKQVVDALLATPELFRQSASERYVLTPAQNERLQDALHNLDKALKNPLRERLSIEQEMYRSILFSRLQFDSVPLTANRILEGIKLRSADMNINGLRQFSHLIEPETWSPGDQDSKPDMTVAMLEKGTELNRRAMMFHYYRTLALLGDDAGEAISDTTRAAIGKVMCRLLKTGLESEPVPKDGKAAPVVDGAYAKARLLGQSKREQEGDREVMHFADQFQSHEESAFFKNFLKQLPDMVQNSAVKPYADTEEMLKDLDMLRSGQGIKAVIDPQRPNLSSIDALIIQVMNFKQAALRVQIRQNAQMHREVLDYLVDLVPSEAFPPEVKEKFDAMRHRPENATGIETLLDEFMSARHPEFTRAVKTAVEKRMHALEKKGVTRDDVKKGTISQEDFNFYQTMGSLGLAAQHPDRVSRYLIAECRSKTDMLEAFFMLKVMESIKAPGKKEKVEIVNLVEHPDMAMVSGAAIPAASMSAGAMQNPWFREHHLGITTHNHLIEDYSIKNGDGGPRRMTVAEVKNVYGLKHNEGDEKKLLMGTKMMMGAGSDITKQGSGASAATMMDAMEKTREALLNSDTPVLLIDYIGCGGGVHRSQPVSSSFETVQGRSMRQSPEAITHKNLNLLTRHLRQRLAMNPTEAIKDARNREEAPLARTMSIAERTLMCRVNMGNMANLPMNPGMWEQQTRPRTYAMINTYEDLYKSKEFKELNAYTARPFVDVTQFAARPPARVSKSETKEQVFPPEVDVEKTRAIGFGAALNASGICAPLFFGGSKFLEGIDSPAGARTLRQIYLYDPKAQDTLNRMTYGIIMADMDLAWRYLGYDVAPSPEMLDKIASGNPDAVDRMGMARKSLARIHQEYNVVANRLLKLHQGITGKPIADVKDGKEAAKAILASLPTCLREQVEDSRDNIKASRYALSDLFALIASNRETLDSIKTAKFYDSLVYPAMGTIYECFEHTPRAYTRPVWVRSVELPAQKAQSRA